MNKTVLYIHGKGGSYLEAEQYKKNCPGWQVIGVDYEVDFPWLVRGWIREAYDQARQAGGPIRVIANSIGAYFAMLALQGCKMEKALFISPVLDMERLILDMMGWARVSEEELRRRGEIPTEFGETLSWKYLCYVRENPIAWKVPTDILYAGGDSLISRETVDVFVRSHPASLTVMENGEHWFHTAEQLAFLDEWMKKAMA